MKFKKQIISLTLALVPLFGASAQSSEALGFGRISQDAFNQGLAGAGFVSASTAAFSSMANPVAALDSPYVLNSALSYNKWAASGTSYGSAGLAYRFGEKFSLSAGAIYGKGTSQDVYNADGAKTGTFAPSQFYFSIGGAYRVLPVLSLGVNVHYLSETLTDDYTYGAVSTDIVAATEFSGLKIAVGAMSLGGKVKSYSGEKFSLPSSVKLAAGYEGCSLGILSYGAYFDSDYYFASQGFGASIGAMAGYQDLFSLRAGYHYGSEKCLMPSYASVGLGGGYQGLTLNLAYLFGGEIAGTLMVGLGYSF